MGDKLPHYIIGEVQTKAGRVPRVSTRLNFRDKLGSYRVRWSIGRENYAVTPGIYAVGNPSKDSPVLVTANYKLSFDVLRQELKNLNAWIMVLDTQGINVWCAAGKGTFGTEEIVNRIKLVGLNDIVDHRKIILPQLAAPGVSAHEIQKQSGFQVIFGPVRAADIESFIRSNFKATQSMRRVTFTFMDRLHLVPVELVGGLKYLFLAVFVFLFLSGFSIEGYSIGHVASQGVRAAINIILAYLCGTILGPLLLPWLPGKSFSMKGAFIGLIATAFSCVTNSIGNSAAEIIAWLLIMPAVSSFILMNFTGASTYTSLSGVQKEMAIAVPLQIVVVVLGILLWIVGRFLGV